MSADTPPAEAVLASEQPAPETELNVDDDELILEDETPLRLNEDFFGNPSPITKENKRFKKIIESLHGQTLYQRIAFSAPTNPEQSTIEKLLDEHAVLLPELAEYTDLNRTSRSGPRIPS